MHQERPAACTALGFPPTPSHIEPFLIQDESQATGEPPSSPWEALQLFTDARNELDVLIDMINYLENRPCLALKHVEPPQAAAESKALYTELKLRESQCKLQLTDVAQRLR